MGTTKEYVAHPARARTAAPTAALVAYFATFAWPDSGRTEAAVGTDEASPMNAAPTWGVPSVTPTGTGIETRAGGACGTAGASAVRAAGPGPTCGASTTGAANRPVRARNASIRAAGTFGKSSQRKTLNAASP